MWKTDQWAISDDPVWTPMTDFLPNIGIYDIAIDYNNPDIMYIGTGDKDAYNSQGIGILKTTDGGNTWSYINNDFEKILNIATIYKIIIHPTNPQIIFLTTDYGFYRTFNGGEFWEKIFIEGYSPTRTRLELNPTNPDILYLATTSGFFKTSDGGETWEKKSDLGGRVEIGVTEANPNYVYLLRSKDLAPEYWGFAGLYLSTDAGETFTLQSNTPNILGWYEGNDIGGQGWYDLTIAVDPFDENRLFVGGINIWYSEDRGETWSKKSNWYSSDQYVHADQHCMTFVPGFNHTLLIGNDGGVYSYKNYQGDGFFYDISGNLAISQIYRLGQNANDPTKTICGLQDNGTEYASGQTWTEVIGGDGFECLIDYDEGNVDKINNVITNGDIERSKNYWTTYNIIASPVIHGIEDNGGWINPYKLDVNNSNTMYIGYTQLWRSTNVKADNVDDIVWSKISFFQDNKAIKDFEQSQVNPDLMIIARSSFLYKCENISSSNPYYEEIKALPGTSFNEIALHPTNENIFYYSTSDNGIFKSNDKGQTFTDISGSLPDVNINSIVLDKNSDEGIYIGTDIGVFYKNANMTDWIPYSNGLPNVIVTELEIAYAGENSKLKAATFGRGLWQTDLDCQNVESQTLNITGTLQTSYRHAGIDIYSDAFVPVGENVTFRAGTKTRLEPGFKAEKGSDFKAVIGQCENTSQKGSIKYEMVNQLYRNFSNHKTEVLNIENSGITIYPNPGLDYIYVQTENQIIDELEIIDISGVEKLTLKNIGSNQPINISTLKQGIYIVKIKSNQNIYYSKIIKNN